MNHHASKKEMVIAFSSVGALAVLFGIIALTVAMTRPGNGVALEKSKEDRQKWTIDVVPLPRGGPSTITDALLSTETRHSQGKPRVERRTIYYRDWDDGKDRVWNVDSTSTIRIDPEKEYKD